MAVGRYREKYGLVFPPRIVTDSRGNKAHVPDFDNPDRVRMSVQGLRSNRTEIAGQLTNEVVRALIDPEYDLKPWSVVEFEGRQYDLSAPPMFREGTRRTRHWVAELRARPPSRAGSVV